MYHPSQQPCIAKYRYYVETCRVGNRHEYDNDIAHREGKVLAGILADFAREAQHEQAEMCKPSEGPCYLIVMVPRA